MLYLILTQGRDTYFKRTNFLVKGLALTYCLQLSYSLTFGSGSCLNPALGFGESILMIGKDRDVPIGRPTNVRNMCIWVYMTAPFVGAAIAASLFSVHESITLEVEQQEADDHQKKMNESRTVDKIDVEDTRSIQSFLHTE